MHEIEPFYSWQNYYVAAEDELSPFYKRKYSEFEFTNQIYNYLIHPQWDYFGSETLYLKILFVSYEQGFCIIEFIGEWNDALYNDIKFLKRKVVEPLIDNGIRYFILLGENILNFHAGDEDYYQEWKEEIEHGWICCVNFRNHVIHELSQYRIHRYFQAGSFLQSMNWRNYTPFQFFDNIRKIMGSYLPS